MSSIKDFKDQNGYVLAAQLSDFGTEALFF